jgi:hypothetical protein
MQTNSSVAPAPGAPAPAPRSRGPLHHASRCPPPPLRWESSPMLAPSSFVDLKLQSKGSIMLSTGDGRRDVHLRRVWISGGAHWGSLRLGEVYLHTNAPGLPTRLRCCRHNRPLRCFVWVADVELGSSWGWATVPDGRSGTSGRRTASPCASSPSRLYRAVMIHFRANIALLSMIVPQISRGCGGRAPARDGSRKSAWRWEWATRLPPMIAAAGMKRHWRGILHWFQTRIANGIMEAIDAMNRLRVKTV